GEDGSECVARVQFLRRRWILGVHVNDEVSILGKERHLTLRVATIGAVRVSLDEFPYGEAIRGLGGGDGGGRAHETPRSTSRMARGSTNASIPYLPYSRPTPEHLNPPQGACGSSVMPLITSRPARNRKATRRARSTSVPRTAPWRPYFESLAIRTASDSESYQITQSTVPKISSWAIVMSFFTLTNTVGFAK